MEYSALAENDLLIKIQVSLDSGNYPAKVARILGLSRQKVDYWIKKAVKNGFLELKSRGVVTRYRLTPARRALCQRNLTGSERVVRVDAFSLKYPILSEAEVPVDWRKVKMQNWDRLVGSELGIRVEKTSRSLIVHADRIHGRDPWRLFFLAYRECERAARHIESRFRMRLGEGQLLRKPHFAVSDPIAKFFGRFMEFSDDVSKLDESEGEGELEFFDPDFLKDYLLTFTVLPKVVARYGVEIREIREVLNGYGEVLSWYGGALKAFEKTIWQHLELIKEYLEESRRNREESRMRTYEMGKRTDQFIEAIEEVVDYLHRHSLLSRLKSWLLCETERRS